MTADLIAKLEVAEGPSRELDQEIAKAAGLKPSWRDDGEARFYSPGMSNGPAKIAPPFTSSLDAALTLVPDGLRIYMERKPTDPPQPWFVTVRPHAQDGWDAVSDYPALALCIAALRARGEG